MSTTEYHLEEYKILMEDRLTRIQEIRKLELYVLGGMAAIYSWLFTSEAISDLALFVPVILPIFGCYRSLMLKRSVAILNTYIKKLETEFNGASEALDGFETWRGTIAPSGVTRSSFIFWITLILFSAVLPFLQRSTQAEQGDAVQPATAVHSKSVGGEKPKSESKGRSQ